VIANKSHFRIGLTVDVKPLKEQLDINTNLFDRYNMRRTMPGSPHSEMEDIWIRYNDIQPFLEKGSFEGFADEHDSIWYPAYLDLPAVRQIIFDIMAAVDGERLGGVLITKLPPGGKIAAHTDSGWHAAYYQKFYVPIKNAPGATFNFEDGVIDPTEGDVYFFDNSQLHWVENNSDQDRIAMIVCIRRT